MLAVLLLAGALGGATDPALLRQAIARVATAQLKQLDPAWAPEQRDCAGFVRFVYRSAFKQLEPERVEKPLWRDAKGRETDFAGAENLLAGNFELLGRGPDARAQLQSGDLLAFRQGEPGAEVFHLMLVVRDADPAHAAFVLYHPGEPGAALRGGALQSLATDAPREWRPVPQNPAFLGFYRLKEWAHGSH